MPRLFYIRLRHIKICQLSQYISKVRCIRVIRDDVIAQLKHISLPTSNVKNNAAKRRSNVYTPYEGILPRSDFILWKKEMSFS